jgi:hypothetical protein
MAKSAIASATYSALSCQGSGDALPARVSSPKLMVTAFSCSAMYGTMPSTATKVIAAARPELRPSRVATRSASEVELCSRASRTTRCSTPKPSAYSRIVPMNVGGTGQPERCAWVTVP